VGAINSLCILVDIKKEKLKMIGHPERMKHGRVIKEIFESKPERRTRKERPKLRLLKDVERVLREMKVKRW
jgi:hypothetical protein